MTKMFFVKNSTFNLYVEMKRGNVKNDTVF